MRSVFTPGASEEAVADLQFRGQLRRHSGLGMCSACWQRRPERPFVRVANLIAELDDPPDWLNAFAAHVAGPQCAPRASALISGLGRLLRDGGPTHPQALLERARTPGRSGGTLAKVLQDFFTTRAMALPVDHATQLSVGPPASRRRRARTLARAVAGFADFMLQARDRAAVPARSPERTPPSTATCRPYGLASVSRPTRQARLGHR